MLDYLDQRNKDPKPFVWTANADLILGKAGRFSKRISRSGHLYMIGARAQRLAWTPTGYVPRASEGNPTARRAVRRPGTYLMEPRNNSLRFQRNTAPRC
jgi:hypothetical protein